MNQSNLVLKLAMVTGELLKRSQRNRQEKQASETARPGLVKEALDSLVKHERITEEQREKVASQLAEDPNFALTLLRDVARHRNAAESAIGRPGGTTKTASAESPRRPAVVGQRPVDFDDTEHGRRFAERMSNPTGR